MNIGVLYVATGKKCCLEAIENAKRSLNFQDNLLITIKTDQVELALNTDLFAQVLSFDHPSHSYRDKIVGMIELPFDTTLFLDSDACLVHSAQDLFSLTCFSDLAAVSAPVRHPPGWTDSSVPLLFPELNTGVLLMRRSSLLKSLIQSWLDLYDSLVRSNSQFWDQASFRSVLWSAMHKQNLRFLNLPSEVNLRTTKPWIAGRGLPVQIIHGRYPDAEFLTFVDYLNSDIDRFRTWNEWLSLHPDTQIRPRFDRTFS